MKNFLKKYYIRITPIVIFLMMLTEGIFLHKDYGVTFDDLPQHAISVVNYSYVTGKKDNIHPHLYGFKDRDYGVVFELPMAFIEKDLLDLDYETGRDDMKKIIHFRHLSVHILYGLACALFFLFLHKFTGNYLLSIIGVLMILLTPRIFAHSFYNTKDIPFMSMYMISMWAFIMYLSKKNIGWLIVLSLSIAMLTGTRVMGIQMFLISLTVIIYEYSLKKEWKKLSLHTSIHLLLTALFLYAMWPYLWNKPLMHFAEIFKNMSNFRWKGETLYMGVEIRANELPWHYSIFWILITTPVLYLVFFLIGSIFSLIKLIKSKFHFDTKDYILLMSIGSFFGSIAAVIALKSTLYDGWRQLYYIYPAFIAITIWGCYSILKKWNLKIVKYATFSVLSLSFLLTLDFMINNHPFQQVYFNEVMPKEDEYLRKNYELDYWGLSFKQGLEYIASQAGDERVNVYVHYFHPTRYNGIVLDDTLFNKLHLTEDFEEAEYIMENYRSHPEDFDYPNEVFSIKVQNSTVLSVFKK